AISTTPTSTTSTSRSRGPIDLALARIIHERRRLRPRISSEAFVVRPRGAPHVLQHAAVPSPGVRRSLLDDLRPRGRRGGNPERAQQRACADWVPTFNHVRPHEALGMKAPGEVYRVSARRPGRVVVGGYPDGCRMADVRRGKIQVDGWKVYTSHA